MKRKLIAGILLCLLVSASLCKAFAHKDDQHYKEIESVYLAHKLPLSWEIRPAKNWCDI